MHCPTAPSRSHSTRLRSLLGSASLPLAASVTLALTLGSTSAHAGIVNFNGTSSSWNSASDWSSGTVPQPSDDLLFTSGGTTTLDASYTIQTLSFDIGGNTVSINANGTGTTGQTLTLNGTSDNDALGNSTTVVDLSSGTTGTVNIGVANGVGTTTVMLTNSEAINVSNASATLDFGANSVISGAGSSILFGGAGTLILAGANTFGGAGSFFAMNQGTLVLNNASALGDVGNLIHINGGTLDNTSGGAITLNNYAQAWGGDFTFSGTNALNLGQGAVTLGNTVTITVNGSGANGALTVGGAISDNSSGYGLIKAGNGTLILTGAQTFTGGTTINSGVLQIGDGKVNGSMGTGTYLIAAGTRLLFNQGATPVSPAWANISGSGTLELSDAASGPVFYSQLTLPGTFTGSLVVDVHGRLQGNPSGLGGTSSVVINSGGQFLAYDTTTNAYTFNQPFSISGLGTEPGLNFGALRVSVMNATFAGPITLTANSGLFLQNASSSSMTVSGVISDGGYGYSLAINNQAANAITLSGANTYTGTTSLNQGILDLANSLALQFSNLKMAGGTVVFDSSVSGGAFTTGGLSGTGNLTLADNAPTPNPITLTVTTTGISSYSGILSGAGGLTMTGSGTQTLSGASTYTGPTTISTGTLEVSASGSLAASPVTIGAATLQIDSAGKTFNSITIADPGANLAIGAAPGQTTTVTNTLQLSTNYTVTPIFLSAPTVGTINLLTAGSITGSGTGLLNLSQYGPTRVTGTLGVSGNTLQLTITSGGANLVWSNGTNSGNWNVAGDSNFKNSGSPDVFKSFDTVTFDSTVTPGTVNLVGTLAPTALTIGNTTGTYTFSGTGSIVGPAALTKTGAGAVALATSNTYTGGTNLNGGLLTLGSSGALGSSGTISFGGGTLQYSAANTTDYSSRFAATAGQAYNVDTNSQNVTWAAALTSSGGTLTKSGNGILTLTGANTYAGGTTVKGGVLQIGNGSVNGTVAGTYSISSGATLLLKQGGSPVTPAWANFSGVGALELGDAASGAVLYTQLALPVGFTGTLILDNHGRVNGNVSNLGTAASVVINNGAQFLAYDGTTNSYTFPQAISISGLGSEGGQNFGALRVSVMKAIFTGPITLTGNSGLFLQGNAGGVMTVSGVISDGGNGYTLAINNQNSNPMTLSGQNTYTGATTINSGTLVVNGSISGSSTTVNGGTTLTGTGTTGPVTVKGGTLLPGSSSTLGTFHTGTLAFSGGGTFSLRINTSSVTGSGAVASNVDVITGNLTLGATAPVLSLSDSGGGIKLAIGDTIPFATYTGAWDGNLFSVGGTTIPNGGTFTVGSNMYQLTYNGGGNTVILTVVPEPGAYASLLAGLGILAGLQRFRASPIPILCKRFLEREALHSPAPAVCARQGFPIFIPCQLESTWTPHQGALRMPEGEQPNLWRNAREK